MATQVFFTDALSDMYYDQNYNNRALASQRWTNKALSTSRGSGLVSHTRATVAGPTTGIEPLIGGTTYVDFITPPIDQDVTISGSITLNLWASETNMSANVSVNCTIDRITTNGGWTDQIAVTNRTTEVAVTTATANNFTVTPTSTALTKGERIKVRIFFDDSTANMSSGFSASFNFGGTTGGADGDSYVTFNETFGFLTTAPSGTKFYLTDTAGPAVGANDERLFQLTRGSGSATAVKNTANGPLFPASHQWTATAGGTAIEWWTNPLNAFTLEGLCEVSLWLKESNAAANVGVKFELGRFNGAGSSGGVWVSHSVHDCSSPGVVETQDELPTTSTKWTAFMAGDSLSVSNGDRLRLRVYMDDAANGTAVTGHTATITYSGNTADADGDSYILLSESVSEQVTRQKPPYRRSRIPIFRAVR